MGVGAEGVRDLVLLPPSPRRPAAGNVRRDGGVGPGGAAASVGLVRGRDGAARSGAASAGPPHSSAAEWRTVPSIGGGRKRRTRRGWGPGGESGAGPSPVPAPRPARPGRVAEGGDRGDSCRTCGRVGWSPEGDPEATSTGCGRAWPLLVRRVVPHMWKR